MRFPSAGLGNLNFEFPRTHSETKTRAHHFKPQRHPAPKCSCPHLLPHSCTGVAHCQPFCRLIFRHKMESLNAPFDVLPDSLPSSAMVLKPSLLLHPPGFGEFNLTALNKLPKNAAGLQSYSDFAKAARQLEKNADVGSQLVDDRSKPICIRGHPFRFVGVPISGSECSYQSDITSSSGQGAEDSHGGEAAQELSAPVPAWTPTASPAKSILRRSSVAPLQASQPSPKPLVYDYASSASPASRRVSTASLCTSSKRASTQQRRLSFDTGVQVREPDEHTDADYRQATVSARKVRSRRSSMTSRRMSSASSGRPPTYAGFEPFGLTGAGAMLCETGGRRFLLVVDDVEAEETVGTQCQPLDIDVEMDLLFENLDEAGEEENDSVMEVEQMRSAALLPGSHHMTPGNLFGIKTTAESAEAHVVPHSIPLISLNDLPATPGPSTAPGARHSEADSETLKTASVVEPEAGASPIESKTPDAMQRHSDSTVKDPTCEVGNDEQIQLDASPTHTPGPPEKTGNAEIEDKEGHVGLGTVLPRQRNTSPIASSSLEGFNGNGDEIRADAALITDLDLEYDEEIVVATTAHATKSRSSRAPSRAPEQILISTPNKVNNERISDSGAASNEAFLPLVENDVVVEVIEEHEVSEPEIAEPELSENADPELSEVVESGVAMVSEPEASKTVESEAAKITEPEVAESEVAEQEVAEQEVPEQEIAEQEVAVQEMIEQEIGELEMAEPEVAKSEVLASVHSQLSHPMEEADADGVHGDTVTQTERQEVAQMRGHLEKIQDALDIANVVSHEAVAVADSVAVELPKVSDAKSDSSTQITAPSSIARNAEVKTQASAAISIAPMPNRVKNGRDCREKDLVQKGARDVPESREVIKPKETGIRLQTNISPVNIEPRVTAYQLAILETLTPNTKATLAKIRGSKGPFAVQGVQVSPLDSSTAHRPERGFVLGDIRNVRKHERGTSITRSARGHDSNRTESEMQLEQPTGNVQYNENEQLTQARMRAGPAEKWEQVSGTHHAPGSRIEKPGCHAEGDNKDIASDAEQPGKHLRRHAEPTVIAPIDYMQPNMKVGEPEELFEDIIQLHAAELPTHVDFAGLMSPAPLAKQRLLDQTEVINIDAEEDEHNVQVVAVEKMESVTNREHTQTRSGSSKVLESVEDVLSGRNDDQNQEQSINSRKDSTVVDSAPKAAVSNFALANSVLCAQPSIADDHDDHDDFEDPGDEGFGIDDDADVEQGGSPLNDKKDISDSVAPGEACIGHSKQTSSPPSRKRRVPSDIMSSDTMDAPLKQSDRTEDDSQLHTSQSSPPSAENPSSVTSSPVVRRRSRRLSKRKKVSKKTESSKNKKKRQWRELSHLPVDEVRIDDGPGPRRSKRQRFPRLKYWKNEVVSYERRSSQMMPTVSEVLVDVGDTDSEEAWMPRW
eukprot:TRINITY_DN1011_c0_g1_i1.p2 TRINITY_DN1011_c0_g1~~TRINITY_DN1011_c0_g1_i1.p2  ORF type:complete len:1423 (+),score=265.33 TRINITY_DN1011_c0_g1_i1:9576-13844(+)